MLQSIHLQGFKGFKDTEVGPFKKVNLILGGQNVGKTSLLEAVYATTTFDAEYVGTQFRVAEGNDIDRYSKSVFGPAGVLLQAHFDDDLDLAIARKNAGDPGLVGFHGVSSMLHNTVWAFFKGRNYTLADRALPISVHLPDTAKQVQLFGQVTVARKKRQLLALLRQVEPRLESLDAVSPDGEQRIYAELSHEDRAFPLHQLGHGFSRLLVLFSHLLVSESKLALIDEVENGIHYTALPTLFEGIKAVAQDRGVQSLMTTHSWDAIRAACEVFAETPELFQVIRLERDGDNIKAVCIEGERMLRLMAQDMEVR